MIEKLVWNGGISGAYAQDSPRHFYTQCCAGTSQLLPWCGGCGGQHSSTEYPPELFECFCVDLQRRVLIRFGSHPLAAF